MNKLLSVSIIAITVGAPAALAQSAAQPHKLTVDELRARFAVPHTNYTAGSYGPKTVAIYYAKGQIILRSPQVNDTGTYRITDDGLYCSKYRTLRDGVETCQTIWQTGPDSYESHLPNGSIVKTTSSVPGNPEGL